MSLRWTGLDELVQSLTDAPSEVRTEALGIVREETEAAAIEISQHYAVGPTGTLRRRVKTEFPSSTILIGIVRSTAPHAHLYEFGTKRRTARSGANRGTMPAKETTVPIAQRRRLRMFRRLKDLLVRRGFAVPA